MNKKEDFTMEKKRTRIKIKDLPRAQKISKEEIKRIVGGILVQSSLGLQGVKYEIQSYIKELQNYPLDK
jgi:hypothetical protein